jgi:hypothetical protein
LQPSSCRSSWSALWLPNRLLRRSQAEAGLPTVDPGVFQPFVEGLLGKYGWLTILLAIRSLPPYVVAQFAIALPDELGLAGLGWKV